MITPGGAGEPNVVLENEQGLATERQAPYLLYYHLVNLFYTIFPKSQLN